MQSYWQETAQTITYVKSFESYVDSMIQKPTLKSCKASIKQITRASSKVHSPVSKEKLNFPLPVAATKLKKKLDDATINYTITVTSPKASETDSSAVLNRRRIKVDLRHIKSQKMRFSKRSSFDLKTTELGSV